MVKSHPLKWSGRFCFSFYFGDAAIFRKFELFFFFFCCGRNWHTFLCFQAKWDFELNKKKEKRNELAFRVYCFTFSSKTFFFLFDSKNTRVTFLSLGIYYYSRFVIEGVIPHKKINCVIHIIENNPSYSK